MIFFYENIFLNDSDNRKLALKVRILQFSTTFMQVYVRPKNLLKNGCIIEVTKKSFKKKWASKILFFNEKIIQKDSDDFLHRKFTL